jgi:hypothetical protein
MAVSVREEILAYLATLLSAAAGFTFYRSRQAPVDRAEGLVGILLPDEEEDEYKANLQALSTMVICITIIARGDEPDSVADPAIVSAHAAIMKDVTLNRRCALITKLSTKWDFEVADRNAVAVEMRYRIRYSTAINDLTQPA